MDIPVYLFTGFIDSGKTTLMRDTIESEDFEAYRNLIICCEEGDEEYDEDFLKRNKAFYVKVDSESQLTAKFLKELAKQYDPDQVMIEYNGTWKMESLLTLRLPKNWQWYGIYSTVDTTTVDNYLNNMRQMFMEQFSQSGLVIFNRCEEEVDRTRLRGVFKNFNPAAQIIFEREDGEMFDPANDPMPYDTEGPVIAFEDIDFGTWFIDAGDHPERYMGKTIKFRAQVYDGKDLPPQTFVPGRFIMTCCADDIRFMGYKCSYTGKLGFKMRDWVIVEAEFGYGFDAQFNEEAPNLRLISVQAAEPASVDPVFF